MLLVENNKKNFFPSDWPLMGSHLICLFLGLAVSHVNAKPSLEETISPYKALIPVKSTQFKHIKSSEVYGGMRAMLLRVDKKNEKRSCLISEAYAKVQKKNFSFFVEASSKDIFSYLKLFRRNDKNHFLIPYERALSYELCSRKPEVTYGSF